MRLKKSSVTFLAVGLFLFSIGTINGASESANTHLQINLEVGFKGENVRILLDGKEFYSGQNIVTNQSSGLAMAIKGAVTKGDHEISLVINNKPEWTGHVTVARETYVGLSLRRFLGFSYVTSRVSDKPFLYD